MLPTAILKPEEDDAYIRNLNRTRSVLEALAEKYGLTPKGVMFLDDSDTFMMPSSEPSSADGSYTCIRLYATGDLKLRLSHVDATIHHVDSQGTAVYMFDGRQPDDDEDLYGKLKEILARKGVLFTMIDDITCSLEFTADTTEFRFTCAYFTFGYDITITGMTISGDDKQPSVIVTMGRWDIVVNGVRYERMRYD